METFCGIREMVMSRHNSLKFHIIWLAITGIFCVSCIIVSALIPRIGFDVSSQNTSNGSAVVVKRLHYDIDEVQPGDIVETVSGRHIQTSAEFYYALLNSGDTAELTIRRTNKFQRPVEASEFAHGAIPAGIRSNDKPVLIEVRDGEFSPLEGVDFDTLRQMLEAHGEPVSVVFKRQEELITTSIHLYPATYRTLGTSLIFLLVALMGLAVARRGAFQKGSSLRASIILGLAAVGMTTLWLWSTLRSIPILFMFGIVGLTMFKVVDFDYHLTHFGAVRRREFWTRVILYVGPVATLIVLGGFCLSNMPMLWNGTVDADTGYQADRAFSLLMVWALIYTVLDAGVMVKRRHKDFHQPLQPYEIGLCLSSFFAICVLTFMFSDSGVARWFMMALILTQGVSNVIPCLMFESSGSSIRLDDPMFSLVPVREALDRVQEAFGKAWMIQVVIDRPTPKHVVSLVRSDEDDALNGLAINVLSDYWRDFFEVFRVEGTPITGEAKERDERNPVSGIADRLGIVVALPIADNVAGTLTSLSLVVGISDQNKLSDALHFTLSPSQRTVLSETIDILTKSAPALVYQSAEICLDFIGDDLNEIALQTTTASFARGLRNSTAPLNARELPHGLLDEELEDEEELSTISEPVPEPDTPSQEQKEFDTRVYEEEVVFLRSQVQALYSQQMREYALAEIELTAAQKATIEEIEASDPPILFIGEPGTGRRLLAHAAHMARSEGAFLTIDAAEVPESIFMLDVFGDGDNPGLIQAAAGGSLLVQNIDRLSENVLDDILKTVQELPARESVALYMTITTTPVEFSVSQYRLEPLKIPARLKKIAIQTDAEIIAVDPLRDQADIDIVAEFYRQKQAIRANKTVDGFTPEAMLALKSYAWPGNFSEMKSVVERAVMHCDAHAISVKDLGRDFVTLADASTKDIALSSTDVFREQVQVMNMINESQQEQIGKLNERIAQLEAMLNTQHPTDNTDEDAFLDGSFADIEKRLLDKILTKYHRDPDKAADALALNRARFFNKLSKYQLI